VVFPRTFEKCKDLLIPNRVVVVGGKLDSRADREEHNLIADWFKEPHEFLLGGPAELYVGDEPPTLNYIQEPDTGFNASPMARPQPRAGNGNGDDRTGAGPALEVVDRTLIVTDGPNANQPDASSNPAQVLDLSESLSHGAISESPEPAGLPPEPPAPPAILYITLKRSGNTNRDFDKLSRLYEVLCTKPGPDQFVVVLEGERKVELTFPNETTLWTPGLREEITALLGPDNVKVIHTFS
jgi:hypothetical protein